MKSIIFDLDDTLLDTSGFLIPAAAREACQAMIDAGLNCDLETCLQTRTAILRSNPRSQVYRELAEKIGVRPATYPQAYVNDVAFAGHKAFHIRNVEENIKLRDGATELLRSLQNKYRLILVTAGDPATQKRKIDLLNIAHFFSQIEIVDVLTQTKQQAFKKLQEVYGGTPFEYLSVGNRVDSDIAPAKRLGWKTCWVRYGEHIHMTPETADETADFEVEELKDLPQACSL